MVLMGGPLVKQQVKPCHNEWPHGWSDPLPLFHREIINLCETMRIIFNSLSGTSLWAKAMAWQNKGLSEWTDSQLQSDGRTIQPQNVSPELYRLMTGINRMTLQWVVHSLKNQGHSRARLVTCHDTTGKKAWGVNCRESILGFLCSIIDIIYRHVQCGISCRWQ